MPGTSVRLCRTFAPFHRARNFGTLTKASPPGCTALTMSRRSIDSYFVRVDKRPKTEGTSAAVTASVSSSQQQPALSASPAVRKALTPEEAQANLAELQENANRNNQAAALAVSEAAAGSKLPALTDLLTDASWRTHMAAEFKKPYFAKLEAFVHQEWQGPVSIFPPQPSIFRAFNTCSFDGVKVVILGQDPYHTPGAAMGLCFAVPPEQRVPPSLQNMYKELKDDCDLPSPKHGNLEKWAQQGVLLLNTVLTVRSGAANSHQGKGWEQFTDAAIKALSKHRSGLVFLLWGTPAKKKAELIDRSKHHILTCVHPSPLSAARGFFGCEHFSKTNKLLEKEGLQPIDWLIPPTC